MRKDEFIEKIEAGDILMMEFGSTLIEATISEVCENELSIELDDIAMNLINESKKIIAESMEDHEEIYILYINDKPAAKYADINQARSDVKELLKKFPTENIKIIKRSYTYSNFQIDEATYQGRKVSLGKPFLTPDGPKKRSVYVKNPKGNVVKVNFGQKGVKIKKSIPARRKSFRARHNCENPGPRHKARYWSCKFW